MDDLFDRLTDMRDQLDNLMREEAERADKLKAEVAAMNIQLALANALAALERASPYIKHNSPRAQIMGAKAAIKKVLAA
jgi:hypothetical protein